MHCCGAEIILGSAAAFGAGSIASSIISSSSSNDIANKNLHAQSRENQINRDWQTAEAEKARQFDTSERIASQDWQKYMTDYENAYNSPEQQALRLRQAGLNPAVAMNGNVQNVSASSSPSSPATSPMPSGVSGISPVPQQPFSLDVGSIINGIGNFTKSIGEAKKLGVETDYIKRSFDLNLKSLSNQSTLQELAIKGQQLANAVTESTKDSRIKSAIDEAIKVHWEAILAEKQGISEDLRQKVLASEDEVNKALAKYHGNNAQLLAYDVATYFEAYQNNQALKKAQTKAAESSAAASDAAAAVDKQRERIERVSADLRETGKTSEMLSLLSDLSAKNEISKADFEQARLKLQRISDLLERRKNGLAFKQADSFLEWIKDKVSIFK